jgi:hypothetical protein
MGRPHGMPVIVQSWPKELKEAVRETGLTLAESKRIIGGPLGRPGKMPCATFGQDSFQCSRGSELALIPNSVCSKCYARSNFYRTWGPVIKNRQQHQANIYHPRWVDAMVVLICDAARETPYFRWFDSGDLASPAQLAAIIVVAMRTPHVKHWLATREREMVLTTSKFLAERGATIPRNLVIRVSADMVDDGPPSCWPTTSTVHRDGDPVGFECRADFNEEYACGTCRACWKPGIANISYKEH